MEHNLFWRLLRSFADKDVISRGFCLDGFTFLSAALGARLTNALAQRLRARTLASDARMLVTEVKGAQGFLLYRLYSLLLCFPSVHLLFIRQLRALDFPQTLAISGRHTNSASGLLLNRLSSDNRFHVEEWLKNVFQTELQMKQGQNAE